MVEQERERRRSGEWEDGDAEEADGDAELPEERSVEEELGGDGKEPAEERGRVEVADYIDEEQHPQREEETEDEMDMVASQRELLSVKHQRHRHAQKEKRNAIDNPDD